MIMYHLLVSMDMTSFFDPYINVRANGKNAYFRSLIYEMEGLTDFDISISGRDTILILRRSCTD